MRVILSQKVKAMKLLDTLNEPLKEVFSELSSFNPDDMTTYSFGVNLNQVENAGLSFDTKVLLISPEL